MTPELNVEQTVEAINHCYHFAGRNELRRAELLCAKKYIGTMRGKTKELDEERLSALIGLLKSAVIDMREGDALLLAVETQRAVTKLLEIRDYIEGLDFEDAA